MQSRMDRAAVSAWRLAMPPVVVAIVLTAPSGAYGFARDELYFRMLDPAWGYLDQPPLVPWLARSFGANPFRMRIPATLAAVACVGICMLIARELGASRRRQLWTGWAVAGMAAVLVFGHVLMPATLDLAAWPLVCLLVLWGQRRGQPAWWLAAGAVAGAATWHKLLIGVIVASLGIGLAVLGPRRQVPWALGGGIVALVLAAPNIWWQVTHDWPQLRMGAALAEANGSEARWMMWVLLVVFFGPPLVGIGWSGLRALWERPDWRPIRFLIAPLVGIVAFTFVGGSQPYYPAFILPVYMAIGMAARDRAEPLLRGAIVANGTVSAIIGLPLVPIGLLGSTPIPAVNQLVGDQVGWEAYAGQVHTAADGLAADDRRRLVVVTSNYGEAGAVAANAADLPVYSGHNALAALGPPPADRDVVVFVGGQLPNVERLFDSCDVVDELDNGVDVDNEEQGQPIAICRTPLGGWSTAWPQLAHLD